LETGGLPGSLGIFRPDEFGLTGIHEGAGEYEAEDFKTKTIYTVKPRVPFAPELLPENGSRRQNLADWVTSPKNTYFARATVNRVWALMTGRPWLSQWTTLNRIRPLLPP